MFSTLLKAVYDVKRCYPRLLPPVDVSTNVYVVVFGECYIYKNDVHREAFSHSLQFLIIPGLQPEMGLTLRLNTHDVTSTGRSWREIRPVGAIRKYSVSTRDE